MPNIWQGSCTGICKYKDFADVSEDKIQPYINVYIESYICKIVFSALVFICTFFHNLETL